MKKQLLLGLLVVGMVGNINAVSIEEIVRAEKVLDSALNHVKATTPSQKRAILNFLLHSGHMTRSNNKTQTKLMQEAKMTKGQLLRDSKWVSNARAKNKISRFTMESVMRAKMIEPERQSKKSLEIDSAQKVLVVALNRSGATTPIKKAAVLYNLLDGKYNGMQIKLMQEAKMTKEQLYRSFMAVQSAMIKSKISKKVMNQVMEQGYGHYIGVYDVQQKKLRLKREKPSNAMTQKEFRAVQKVLVKALNDSGATTPIKKAAVLYNLLHGKMDGPQSRLMKEANIKTEYDLGKSYRAVINAFIKNKISKQAMNLVMGQGYKHYIGLYNAQQIKAGHFEGGDLSGHDLSQLDLTGARLNGTNLTGANLTGAHLVRAHLVGANLERADLIEAHLNGVNLEDANLERADLTGAYLIGSNLRNTILHKAKLNNAVLSSVNLEGADLKEATFKGATVKGLTLFNHKAGWYKTKEDYKDWLNRANPAILPHGRYFNGKYGGPGAPFLRKLLGL